MLKIKLNDTIAAISTALGGGIGIVRLSGENAIEICDGLFEPIKGKRLIDRKSHTVSFGRIVHNGQLIDEVLVTVMKGPNSYTRENIVEINCHGGACAVNEVLMCVLKSGARLAEPGEFTKRAFLNGRIDLTQAQAVADIINAKTSLSLKEAEKRLSGGLSDKIRELREQILLLLAGIEAAIDYPEHDDEVNTYTTAQGTITEVIGGIERLLSGAEMGRIFREGIRTVILGRPNVGKSSLMNMLLGEERAIVTNIPGTTRDTLHEYINIRGIPLHIIDTAGIRETDDEIERMGVEKSKQFADDADLILVLFDASEGVTEEDVAILEAIGDKKAIAIVNKIDLTNENDFSSVEGYVGKDSVVFVSVKENIGIDAIFDRLEKMFFSGSVNANSEVLVSNKRNQQSLMQAKASLENALSTIINRMPEDFISMDLTAAYEFLGEIIGESLEEDLIDKIFSEFCLGK